MNTPSTTISPAARWTGRLLSALVIVFLLLDAAIKLAALPVVTQTLVDLGYPDSAGLARGLGVLTLACVLLYAYPRTAVLGAVLLTGLLGGAMATHLRAGSPVFSHFLFGAYLGLIAWGGLYLRDPRLRALLPWQRHMASEPEHAPTLAPATK
ncbi:MAG TPA: DoxX family protein [Oleiagrimonas sp.]|nr:DoxX family protein [Oleiagrimonas sp.]